MKRITQFKARLRAAKAELAIRTRTYNSANRAFKKVNLKITELESKIENLEKIPS